MNLSEYYTYHIYLSFDLPLLIVSVLFLIHHKYNLIDLFLATTLPVLKYK